MGRKLLWIVGLPLAALVVIVLPVVEASREAATSRLGLAVGELGPLAAEMLDEVEELTAACPQMPPAWLLALVEVESSWTADAVSPAGAAGLVQMMPGSWVEAGGVGPRWSAAPEAGHPVFDPSGHLATAVPWMCGRLQAITTHVEATGKPIDPLDAAAVCHVAGCQRVIASATGMPQPGDAGCDRGCVATVTSYVERVNELVERITAPDGSVLLAGGAAAAAPGSSGCTLADPTGTGGCVTARAAHLVAQVRAAWPQWPWGMFCFGARPANPSSDHPKGRACDITVGAIGRFPSEAEAALGWQMGDWLVANAAALQIRYIVWDGMIWYPSGWRRYGGGAYSPTSPTGGHFDHLHVSVQP